MNLLNHVDLVNRKELVSAINIIYFLFSGEDIVYISSTSKGKDFGVAQHLKDKNLILLALLRSVRMVYKKR